MTGLWYAFSHDGQAGISGTGEAFGHPGVSALGVNIRPEDAPGALPDDLYVAGNAYAISVRGVPGDVALTPSRPVNVTLRWPRLPHAIYLYRNGTWNIVCPLRRATYTPITISCPTRSLGVFAAVVLGPHRSHATIWVRLFDIFQRWKFVFLGIAVLGVALLLLDRLVTRRRSFAS
jgi:hypothetical protein